MVDTETLLCLLETPKPLTVHRSLLALPVLATSKASQTKESEDIEALTVVIEVFFTRLTSPARHTSHSKGL